MRYVTEPGDTLRNIAARFTTSPENGQAIVMASGLYVQGQPIPDNAELEAGVTLTIPDKLSNLPAITGTSELGGALAIGVIGSIIAVLLMRGF